MELAIYLLFDGPINQPRVKDELGDDWLSNEKFRFGASSLLNDIERQLHHQATGFYAAGYYMPMV